MRNYSTGVRGAGLHRPARSGLSQAWFVLASSAALAVGALSFAGSAAAQAAPAATPHHVSAHHAAAHSAAMAPSPHSLDIKDYKRACPVTTKPGIMTCMVLLRTNVAHQSQHVLGPDQAPSGDGYGPSSLQPPTTCRRRRRAAARPSPSWTPTTTRTPPPTWRPTGSDWGLPACGTGCFSRSTRTAQTSPLPANAGNNGWAVEESLDIDMVSAICPHCHIILVEASSASTADLGTGVNAAVSLGAKFVSNSYGGCESSSDTTYDTEYYNHPGVAVTASAGDDGYGVDYPAASPYVTAVGGTSLTTASNARGWTETVWAAVGGEGTGSGCSADDAKPTWQTDTGCSKRTDNDVSADADPNTGVAVYDTYSEGGWLEVGGTSASSPIIAATFALAGTPAAGTYPSSYLYAAHLRPVRRHHGRQRHLQPGLPVHRGDRLRRPDRLGTPDGNGVLSPAPPPATRSRSPTQVARLARWAPRSACRSTRLTRPRARR